MSITQEFPASQVPDLSSGKRRFMKRAVYSGIFVVLMFFALAYTLNSNYRSNLEAVYVSADNLLQNISGRVRSEVEVYFNPARDLAALAANLGGDLPFSFSPESEFELFLRDGVRLKSQLVMANVGDRNGNFLMPKMMPDGSTHTKIITWKEDTTGWVQWVRRDVSGNVTEIEAYADSSYDPRTRPWYQGALEAGGEFWTDPYIFFTDRSPGVTVSYPIYESGEGDVKGVVGVDLDLGKVCGFLDGLQVGRTGRAFIHDAEGNLVAYPDMEKLIKESGDRLITAHIFDLENQVYSRVFNRYQLEGPGERVLEVEGERYFSLSTSLESVAGKNWTLQLVAPESDFTGFVRNNLQAGILSAAVVLILTGALAILLSVQGYQSEKDAAMARSLLKENEGHVETLDTLIQVPSQSDNAPRLMESATALVAEGAKVNRVSIFKARDPRGRTGYAALDIYDAETEGHTQGMVLDNPALNAFLKPLASGSFVELRAPFRKKEGLSGFVDGYLKPLGIQHLMYCPVFKGELFLGFIGLENQRYSRKPFSRDTRRYLQAVASWLGHTAEEAFTGQAGRERPDPGKKEDVLQSRETPADAPPERVARRKRFSKAPFHERAKAESIENFQHSEESFVLAVNLPGIASDMPEQENGWDPEYIHKAYLQMEKIAHSLGIEKVLLQGNILLCVESAATGTAPDLKSIGEAALEFMEFLGKSETSGGVVPFVQMGIDFGGCFSGRLGKLHQRDNLWGEAVDGAMVLMESSPAGRIQCSAEVYHHLKSAFVFQDRGRFYFEHLGEVGLFLLTAKVSS